MPGVKFGLFAGLDFIEGQGEDFERALESTGEFLAFFDVFLSFNLDKEIYCGMACVDLIKLSGDVNTNEFRCVSCISAMQRFKI